MNLIPLRKCSIKANGKLDFTRDFRLSVILLDRKFAENKRKIKDGVGIMVWQDGSRYIGQFIEDKMEGKGRMT